MAKAECVQEGSKKGEKSGIRSRRGAASSKDQSTRRLSKDDVQASNGTSAEQFSKGEPSDGASEIVLQMLVMGLSFSTRFYKIAEPAHVW